MSFADPIVSGNILIRDSIQSEGFVAGVSGWSINKDGSAEFSNLTSRGSFKAAGASSTADLNSGRLLMYQNAAPNEETSYENWLLQFSDDSFATATQILADPTTDSIILRKTGGAVMVGFDGSDGYLKTVTGIVPTTYETWHAVSYQNSWSDFGAPMAPVSYRRMPDGTVFLRGMAKGGTQTDGTIVFNIPAGFRPLYKHQFHFRGATDTRIDIDTNGDVTVNGMGGLPAASRLPVDGWRYPLI